MWNYFFIIDLVVEKTELQKSKRKISNKNTIVNWKI